MKIKALLFSMIAVLFAFESYSQDYSLELSTGAFRNIFTQDPSLLDVKSAFNFNQNLSVTRTTGFGKVYVSIGYTTFNYFTQLDESAFSPSDPAFENVFDKMKQSGHEFISLPIGAKINVANSFFIPVELSAFFKLNDNSGIFNDQFLALSTGISYERQLNDQFYLDFSPIFSWQINPVSSPNTFLTKMPFSYGVRFALGYRL